MPPLIDYSSIARDPSRKIAIIEGEKKLLAAVQDGLSAVGIGGVWNWVSKDNGISKPIKDFDSFTWKNRVDVLIVGDSDIWMKEKEQALMGLYALGMDLVNRGVHYTSVKLVQLPNLNSEKTGFDDFYIHYNGSWKNEFNKLQKYHVHYNFPGYGSISKWYKNWKKKLESTEQRRFDKNGKPIFEPLLEGRIFKEGKHLIFLNQQILMYQDGWYQEFDDRYYLKLIEKQIEESYNGRRNKAKEILDVLKDNLYKKNQTINVGPKLINVRNGILNIDKFELLPHTPDKLFTYQINANFNPNTKCDKFEKFLKEVLVNENTHEPDYELIRLVQQFIGYCLYTKTPFHECIMLYGVGRNGKSVLVFVIICLARDLKSNAG